MQKFALCSPEMSYFADCTTSISSHSAPSFPLPSLMELSQQRRGDGGAII
jgi:hypothetical protein